MSMSIPYTEYGRRQQKGRTRDALVQATRRLLAAGRTPTVEEAAAEAAVSRATAYRYFPNQRALVSATYPHLQESSLLPADAALDVEARLEQAVEALTDLVQKHEPELRAMLRLSLEERAASPDQLALRQGRAIGWLEDALAPLREELSARELHRLVLSIRAVSGIEALIWLTDVARASKPEAVEIMQWSARALLRAARAEAAGS